MAAHMVACGAIACIWLTLMDAVMPTMPLDRSFTPIRTDHVGGFGAVAAISR